jgi:phosphoglycolate phosphatase
MLQIANLRIAPRLVVFDKDGTLISFDTMWRSWFDRLLHALAAETELSEKTRQGFAETLGYSLATGMWDPLGPLTLASTREVNILMAGALYRYQGKTWDEALALVNRAEQRARLALPSDLAQPIGDVRALLQQLVDHGILVALATTDSRASTVRTLENLGIAAYFATIVCGDDGLPLKPAPDMAFEICDQLGVSPRQAVMVGDTVADMTMARQAGFGWAVAVTSGALRAEMLAPYADLVIPNIHAIRVVDNKKGATE